MLVTSLHLHLLRRTYLFSYVKVAKVDVYCMCTLDVVAIIAQCKSLKIKVCRVQWCCGCVVSELACSLFLPFSNMWEHRVRKLWSSSGISSPTKQTQQKNTEATYKIPNYQYHLGIVWTVYYEADFDIKCQSFLICWNMRI